MAFVNGERRVGCPVENKDKLRLGTLGKLGRMALNEFRWLPISEQKELIKEGIISDAARLAGYLKEGKALVKERKRKPKETLNGISREMSEYDRLAEKYEELDNNYRYMLPREKLNDAKKIVDDKAKEICKKFQDSDLQEAKGAGFAAVVKPLDDVRLFAAGVVYSALGGSLLLGTINIYEALQRTMHGGIFSIKDFAIGIGLLIGGLTLNHLIASTKSKIRAVERYEKMKAEVKKKDDAQGSAHGIV
ncbi:MAG: hypothetical protein NT051_03175 [Candidatus Micrarchaeota archaeon]|nr:hypothetical protein [Candidatus Micrarchaeota archaeon]